MPSQPADSTNPHIHGHVGSHTACVSLVPIFNHLEEKQMEEVASATRSRSYKKGEYLFQPGDASETLYILNAGLIRIFRLTESGKEQLVRFLKPGDFTGELAVFSSGVHDDFAEALQDTTVCLMERAELQDLLEKYPAVSLKIMEEFSARLKRSEKQTTLVATEKVETRLALFLAELAEPGQLEVVLPMSRKDLASYLGTTPETVSRKLKSLEEQGLIHQITSKRIQIPDLDNLLFV